MRSGVDGSVGVVGFYRGLGGFVFGGSGGGADNANVFL